MDPPPKNGGAPCPGPPQERAPCGLQPCAGGTGERSWAGAGGHLRGEAPGWGWGCGTRRWASQCLLPGAHPPPPHPHPPDCGQGRVHVSAELCRKGLVPPCPPSCLDPEANRSCSGLCLEGETHPASRGAAGKVLGGGGGSVGVQQAHQPSVSTPPPCCPPFSGLRAPSPTQGVAAPLGSFSRTRAACPPPSAPALWAKSCSSQACPSSWTTAADGQAACPPLGGGGGAGRGQGPVPAFRS